eukprot:evm.model.scf_3029.1 EVM.evm.TU.scf_3029.1   scf_3029:8139-10680(+)
MPTGHLGHAQKSFVAALVVAALLPRSGCQPTLETDDVFIESVVPNDTRIQSVALGDPVNGTLPYLHWQVLAFSVPERSADGLGFPDVLLSLEVANPAGNVDVFCNPYNPDERGYYRVPAPIASTRVWGSNHSQGADYVFISSRHAAYGVGSHVDGNRTLADFVCALWGLSRTASQYRLDVDLDYSSRSLVVEERQAVRSLYSKCCGGEDGCAQWLRMEEMMTGVNRSDKAPPLDLCHVGGNVCDDDGHIVRLAMQHFGLDCEFPAKEVAALSRVEKVDMGNNRLRGDVGEIAGELQKLDRLDHFSAVNNDISGSMNDTRLCALVSNGLEVFNLDNNALSGPLPACLFSEDSTLKEIDLDSNDLDSALPPAFAQDAKLEVLSLVNTSLKGTLPKSMENLVNLRVLRLGSNDLAGPVVGDIGTSPFLTDVSMPNNRLAGAVPSSLATNPSLRVLVLDNNSFALMGDAWDEPGALGPNLNEVTLKMNNIKGPLPAGLFTSNVSILDLGSNKFDGPLPDLDSMLPMAWFINLADNNLVGSIPDKWADIGMFNVTAVRQFIGIPFLDLSFNRLSGNIPRFLLNIATLPNRILAFVTILLQRNNFECVELGSGETIQHLRGVGECEEGGKVDENNDALGGVPVDHQGPEIRADLVSVENESSGATAAIVWAVLGVAGTAVVVGLLAAAVFFVVRKRRASAPVTSVGDVEGARGVNVGFERYTDEGTEVQVSAL